MFVKLFISTRTAAVTSALFPAAHKSGTVIRAGIAGLPSGKNWKRAIQLCAAVKRVIPQLCVLLVGNCGLNKEEP